jgi:hypothetical protein
MWVQMLLVGTRLSLIFRVHLQLTKVRITEKGLRGFYGCLVHLRSKAFLWTLDTHWWLEQQLLQNPGKVVEL